MTSLALESELTPELRECISIAKSSAESLLTILNDILDFSKIEAGKLELSAVSFRLGERIEQAMKLLGLRATKKGLTLSWHLHPDVPEVVIADPIRVRQILLNLTENAIKFTERGTVTVEAFVRSRNGSSVAIEFAITDTGIGIPADKQGRIFEAFSQADGSMTRRFGGTGLGLAISSQLVSMMGGTISVRSEPGQGSCFRFHIVVEVPHEPAAAPDQAAPAETAGWKPSPSEPPLRILVAEDTGINRLVVTKLLEKRGCQVTQASNGEEAVEALDRAEFDAILMDLQMPVMSGFEATAIIRKREQGTGRHLPIIALTAHSMKGDRERCMDSGMDDYVTKPIQPTELMRALERHCARALSPAGSIG
jgi:CheY-like chemotaxis protein